jgi:phosphoribosylformylglycinamidine (FGAM) synthase PurS component
MEVKFKIIDVDSSQHSMIVRYYTNLLTEDSLATSYNPDGTIARRSDGSPQRCQTDYNFNIWQTDPPITEEQIKKIANDGAPYDWFKLRHDILDPQIDTSLNVVSNLLNTEFDAIKPVFSIDTIDTNANTESTLSEDHIENLINELLNNSSANTSNTQ